MVDDSDFDAWYADLRAPMAKALAVWCGDASLASDALDEAFVRAIERWDRVSTMASPAGWVWRTATNLVRRRTRRRKHEQQLLRRQSERRDSTDAATDERFLDLRAAIGELPERQRSAVLLFYVADLPTREVAEAMDVAEGTVHATLHQARARLAEILGDEAAAPSTEAEPTPDGVT